MAAVAARHKSRADAFALRHGIPKAYGSYEDLLADPDIDAVYNPLPNSLHGPWTLRAIAAGKHVLCEKPFASNSGEAAQVADAAETSGLVVMEAMHYRYHPLTSAPERARRRTGAGAAPAVLDELRHQGPGRHQVRLRPGRRRADGRRLLRDRLPAAAWRQRTAGEPLVTGALADPVAPDPRGAAADRSMAVRLAFPSGATGWFESSFTMDGEFQADVHAICAGGQVRLQNFIFGHKGRLVATSNGSVVADEQGGGDSTYVGQLRAFAAAIAKGDQVPTSAAHAVTTMRVIDDAYRAAGLLPRPTDGSGR